MRQALQCRRISPLASRSFRPETVCLGILIFFGFGGAFAQAAPVSLQAALAANETPFRAPDPTPRSPLTPPAEPTIGLGVDSASNEPWLKPATFISLEQDLVSPSGSANYAMSASDAVIRTRLEIASAPVAIIPLPPAVLLMAPGLALALLAMRRRVRAHNR